jgi:hypothetical protein
MPSRLGIRRYATGQIIPKIQVHGMGRDMAAALTDKLNGVSIPALLNYVGSV